MREEDEHNDQERLHTSSAIQAELISDRGCVLCGDAPSTIKYSLTPCDPWYLALHLYTAVIC
jgi:hypothetical protein